MRTRRRVGLCPKCDAEGAQILDLLEEVYNNTKGVHETEAVPMHVSCDACGGADGFELARLRAR